MKNHVVPFLIILNLVAGLKLSAQSVVSDALALHRTIDVGNNTFDVDEQGRPTYLVILQKYAPDSLKNDLVKVWDYFRDSTINPFISKYIPERGPLSADNRLIGMLGTAPSFASAVGGLNVTTLADGVAKFMVERAKEELGIAFFDRFTTVIEENKDLQTLFPRTTKILKAMKDEVYDYTKYLQSLQEAFEIDLSNLVPNLTKLLTQTDITIPPAIKAMVLEALFIVAEIKKGTHPGDVLDALSYPEHSENLYHLDSGNTVAAIRLTNLVSQSLRTGSGDRYWESPDSLRALGPHGVRIFFGLQYEKTKQLYKENPPRQIAFRHNGTIMDLQAFLKDAGTKYNSYKAELDTLMGLAHTFVEKAKALDKTLEALKDKLPQDLTGDDILALLDHTLALLQHTGQAGKYIGIPNDTLQANIDKWLGIAETCRDLYVNIQEDKYAAAIVDAMILLEECLGDNFKYKNALLKYGNFMATMVNAESSDEVADAIEAAALPAGSSRIKKETRWDFAIQSYLGVNAILQDEDIDSTNLARTGRFGIHAPIGLAVSKGIPLGKTSMSVTLFLSAVDIGALASFRLSDDSTEIESDIHLGDIISPGANLVVGLPWMPVSLGVGYQASPALLRIVDADELYSNNPAWRWHATIAVDIPLFDMYTVPYKKR